jgi:hypothetical protein
MPDHGRNSGTHDHEEAFAKARAAMLAAAKEPSSIQFGKFYRRTQKDWSVLADPHDIVCFTANGRNSFGGFTGQKLHFYVLASSNAPGTKLTGDLVSDDTYVAARCIL